MSLFEMEWKVLQNQYDSYEKCSLLIKCITIFLCVISVVNTLPLLYVIFIICTLWLQDGIWKTFQSRIEERLYIVEQQISLGDSHIASILPLQFNRQFLENRPSNIGLIKAYVCQSFRPTVAFPYVVLLPIVIFLT